MKEYKKGDKVWYVDGDILVQCTIVDIHDEFRKKDPGAYLFYYLDEPVGHSVGADDVYDTFEEAVDEFREAVNNTKDSYERRGETYVSMSLMDKRIRTTKFILATHLEGDDYGNTDLVTRKEAIKFLVKSKYPLKKMGVEWFMGKEYFKL